jgi:hypothetical protein
MAGDKGPISPDNEQLRLENIPTTPKAHDDRIENAQDEDTTFQKLHNLENVDQFGGQIKTDPAEIALVKKLDWYMLVSKLAAPASLSLTLMLTI